MTGVQTCALPIFDRFEQLGAIKGDLFEFESTKEDEPPGPGHPPKPLILETERSLGPVSDTTKGILGSAEAPRTRSKQPIITGPPAGDGDTATETPSGPEAEATYSVGYDDDQMAGVTKLTGDHIFTDILGDVADSALSAVLRGQNVKDAIVSTAVHRASTAVGTAISDSIADDDAIDPASPNQPPG